MHKFTNIDDWQYLKTKLYIFCILYVRFNQVHMTPYCLKISGFSRVPVIGSKRERYRKQGCVLLAKY